MITNTLNRVFTGFEILFLIVVLTACGGGGDDQSSNNGVSIENKPSVGSDDSDILKAVYFDVRTPDGFYSEVYADSDVYYSISHVKNVEVLSVESSQDSERFELSSDDFFEALEWSEQAAQNFPVYKQMVDSRETDLYFEFERVDINNPQFVHLSRVLKKSVIDRSGVDLDESNSYQGNITATNLNSNQVKMIIEYFWMFSFSNNTGNAVIESTLIETDTSYINTMVEAKLITRSADQCDTVEVYETSYEVQKDTGDIWKNKEMIREISSKRQGDLVVACDNSSLS